MLAAMHDGNNNNTCHNKPGSERHGLQVVMEGDPSDLFLHKDRSPTLEPDKKERNVLRGPHILEPDNDDKVLTPEGYPPRDMRENTIWFENGPAVDHKSRDDEPQLCAGERLDDHSGHPKEKNPVNGNNNLMPEDNGSCSEKRRQFGLMHSPGSSAFQSFDSASSELSSHSRHSLSSFLQARECDAEDVLLGLGLGGDGRMSVPERFLVKSSAKGIDVGVIRRTIDEEDDDIFDTNSLSYSSSWSERNPILERLPKRFITSTSSFGSSTIDLSEPEDTETAQISPLPVIIEPEQCDETSFDLMRHLRLNRIHSHPVREHQHDKILLEPVTEELEVSSVGSGSARTKICSAQQDSLDSIGNTSVLTKISRRHSEDSFKERIPLDNSSFQEDHQQATAEEPLHDNDEDRDINADNSIRYAQANQGDNESGISSAGDSVNYNIPGSMKPPVLRVLTLGTAHHDSLKLVEFATSEEDLVQSDKTSGEKASNGKIKAFKRETSDESSGFEDDAHIKKRSTESLDADDVKTDESNVNCKTNHLQKHFLVPFDVASPETNADTRRSAFAKRSAWSATSKQKRVAFQDKAPESRPKSRSFDQQASSYRLEPRRFSLDVPLHCTDSDIVAESTTDNRDTNQTDQLESTPDKNAVHNIKRFLSSLMSIRSRFRKDAKAGVAPSASHQVLPTSVISVQTSSPGYQLTQVCADSIWLTRDELGQGPRDGRYEEATTEEIQCLVPRKEAFQSLEELESFEENLKRYRTTFMNMQMTSTSQESYYTTKLLARFAWDIVAIRKLRSLINNELTTMQSCITDRRVLVSQLSNTPLPYGVVNQMQYLLSMQCSLQTYLLQLAQSVPSFNWKTTPSPLVSRSAINTSELNTDDMTNEIKHSLFQELNQMFQDQMESLRKELKEKDDVINELLIKVERIEKASGSPK